MSSLYRLLLVAAAILCLSVILLGAGYFLGHRGASSPGQATSLSTATILRQIQEVQELVTVSYRMEKVVALSDPGFLGEERLILIAHGVVKAGIDLSKLQPSDVLFDPDSSTLHIQLPAPRIFDTHLDEFRTQVFMREKPFFRPLNKELDQQARKEALGKFYKGAEELGIRKEAGNRAEISLKKWFESFGILHVEIELNTEENSVPSPY